LRPPGDSHEALEKEVQSLRAQLEAWRLQGEAPQGAPRSQEDSHVPPGYISQEACERSLAEMESSHQQVMEGLQRHHERELQRLQQEKEWLLAEETAATASAIEAMKKAYQDMDIDKVDELMADITEQQEVAQQISDAISRPVGFGDIVDEDELLEELEELEQEELARDLLTVGDKEKEPPLELPSVPSTHLPAGPAPEADEDEEALKQLAEWVS